jgi:hypothetical protein
VYVEETSFRAKSIEGVSTSTAGFVGPARYGPISGDPELLTSLADFERIYGGADDLAFSDAGPQVNFLAHAVRAFFEEGGRRLYVTRVFNAAGQGPPTHYASTDTALISPPAPQLTLRARFPGDAGNMRVTLTLRVGANALNQNPPGGGGPALARVQDFDVVHVRSGSPPTPLRADGLFLARWDAVNRRWALRQNGSEALLTDLPAGAQVRVVTALVEVARPTVNPLGFASPELIGEFGFDPRSPTSLTANFTPNPATRLEALTVPFAIEPPGGFQAGQDPATQFAVFDADADDLPLAIARELLGPAALDTLFNDAAPVDQRRAIYTLQNGGDGALPIGGTYAGDADGFRDYTNDPLQMQKNGLLAFEAVEDISIVAAPGYSARYTTPADHDRVAAIQNELINHCETLRYRVAVLDMPPNQLVSSAVAYRNQRSSNYAALYYPWVTIADPASGDRLNLPPCGFVAGIYARNDIEHAVFKAPANEVVRLAIDFEQRLNKAQQEVLNPDGINCFRYFAGRGFLLWGARTISDDPEWKYVSLRRYFAYLEHSIDRGTQWVVFENNGPQLWDNVRRTVEDFLFNEWRMGGLLGTKPEEAYFVRCDLSTMTQNDLDNGRLVCLIGVAPVRPAEFVIFRIGQWTATTTR